MSCPSEVNGTAQGLYRKQLAKLDTGSYNPALPIPRCKVCSGRGSVRLERCVRDAEVGGPNPPAPTFFPADPIRLAVPFLTG
jgi:hypothetical protein